jgi:hypothetical protein
MDNVDQSARIAKANTKKPGKARITVNLWCGCVTIGDIEKQ